MSAWPVGLLRRRSILLLLVVMTSGMALCARAPAEGPFWRTGFVLAALGGFLVLAVAWRRDGFSTGVVLGIALLLRLIAFPLLPVLSDDGFRYVWDGLVQVEAGVNPYRFIPSDPALASFQDEPIYASLNSAGYFSVYPPLSQFVFGIGALAYPMGWAASWYLIKLVFVAAELVGVWLLSRMVPARALLLYAWNPLVVMESAGQAHTEALAAPLLVLAVWAARRGRGGASAAAVAAAGWVKLLPFVLLPFVIRRFGGRALFVGGAVAVALLLPYAAPYVLPNVGASLDLYVRSFEFNGGLYSLIKGLLGAATGTDWSKQLGPALQSLFLVGVVGLYLKDIRSPASLASAFSVTLGLFFLCATTVHPWYLLPLLALLPLLVDTPSGRLHSAAWLWLSACSMATYWRYSGPAWGYDAAVAVGWTGWTVLVGVAGVVEVLPRVMRARAAQKWRWIGEHLPQQVSYARVLDLGAGDGYVGEVVAAETGADVVLVDVVDFNRTALPFTRFDGDALPFEDGAFDLTLLTFVLHHADDPERVLSEAKRVTDGPIAVLESVAEHPLQRRLFEPLDRLANAVRSGGAMRNQEEHLSIRTDEAWRQLFGQVGLRVLRSERRGRGVHRQRFYLLAPLLQ